MQRLHAALATPRTSRTWTSALTAVYCSHAVGLMSCCTLRLTLASRYVPVKPGSLGTRLFHGLVVASLIKMRFRAAEPLPKLMTHARQQGLEACADC